MNNLFDRILEASWQAGIIALIVLAISFVAGRWIAPRWRCMLWSLVFIRLLLPVLPTSSISVFRMQVPQPATLLNQTTTSATTFGVIAPVETRAATAAAPSPASPQTAPARSRIDWISLLSILWAAGAAMLIARQLIGLWLLWRWVRTLPPVSDPRILSAVADRRLRVVESGRITSPAIAGIIRPVLLLPRGLAEGLSDAELAAILRHEAAHLARRDVLVGLLASLACCIHWFNPLIWFAGMRFRIERELACDEIALGGDGDGIAYGQTILKLLDRFPPVRTQLVGTVGLIGMLGSRRAIRRRIQAISISRRSAYWPLFGPILVLAVGCATLTGPRKPAAPASAASDLSDADSRATVTRVYDIRDVLIDVPNFTNPPTLEMHLLDRAPTTAPGEPAPYRASPSDPPSTQRTRKQLVDELITRITSTIDPYSWQANTGLVGTIEEADGRLIIGQTRTTHARIWKFLQELRGQRSVQVTVEARFIQSPVVEQSLEATGQHWSNVGGTEFDLWPSFLDEAGVQRLISLHDKDERSTMVTAPRLTLFDGQRAYVLVSRSTAFVESMKPKGKDFEPVISIADSGMLFDCQPRVSPDHRNVTLALRPKMTTLLELTEQRWPGAPPGRDDLKIQVPCLKVTALDTTITMPDRHYALYRLRPRYTPKEPTTQPVRQETTLLLVRPNVIVTKPGKIEGVDGPPDMNGLEPQ